MRKSWWKITLKFTILATVSFLVADIAFQVGYIPDPTSGFPGHAQLMEASFRVYGNSSTAKNRTWVIIKADRDCCDQWREAFPQFHILIVGPRAAHSSQCLHITTTKVSWQKTFLFILEKVPIDIYLVDGGRFSFNRLRHMTNKTNSPNILFKSYHGSFYNSQQHWGCGGTDNDRKVSDTVYYACNDIEPVILGQGHGFHETPCDSLYPPMALAPGVFAELTQEFLMVKRRAFWALPFLNYFPGYGRYASMNISLLLQQFLWQSGVVLSVLPPSPNYHQRSTITNKKRYQSIVSELNDLICHKHENILACFKRLGETMTSRGYLKVERLRAILDWFRILEEGDFEIPSSISMSFKHCLPNTMHSFLSKHDATKEQNLVSHSTDAIEHSVLNFQVRYHEQTNLCAKNIPTDSIQKPWARWTNTLLIVTFNRAFYTVIPQYETLYRQFFPHILYCGPRSLDLRSYPILNNISFSYITYGSTRNEPIAGSLSYECLGLAVRLGYDVGGYLVVSDDTLLVPQRLRYFDLNKVWFWRKENMLKADMGDVTKAYTSEKCDNDEWIHWYNYRHKTLQAFHDLRNVSETSRSVKSCLNTLTKLTGFTNGAFGILSDFYYIPEAQVHDIVEILDVFLANGVFLEIAVPTTMHCAVSPSDMEHVYTVAQNFQPPGKVYLKEKYDPYINEPGNVTLKIMCFQDFTDTRDAPWCNVWPQTLNGVTFYHPHKLNSVRVRSPKHVEFYCNWLTFLANPWGSNNSHF